MSNRIRKETDDVIILDNLKSPLFLLLILAFFLGNFLDSKGNVISIFFSFIIFAFIIFLAYETVTIDKKLQSVIIKNFFNIETLYFSVIKEIVISNHNEEDPETGYKYITWDMWLNTIHGNSTLIYSPHSYFYSPHCYDDAERAAKKISKITNKEVIFFDLNQNKLFWKNGIYFTHSESNAKRILRK